MVYYYREVLVLSGYPDITRIATQPGETELAALVRPDVAGFYKFSVKGTNDLKLTKTPSYKEYGNKK